MKHEIIELHDVQIIGMAKKIAFNEQYEKFHKEWLPAHPEYKWVPQSCCMEWYQGTDIESPDYQCGVMMPFEEF
jgi:hypothetical protein